MDSLRQSPCNAEGIGNCCLGMEARRSTNPRNARPVGRVINGPQVENTGPRNAKWLRGPAARRGS